MHKQALKWSRMCVVCKKHTIILGKKGDGGTVAMN